MKIISLNVGLPRPVMWKGRRIMTGIFKEPVEGRVRLRPYNLDGDGQADLSVHGGRRRRSTPIRRSTTRTGGASWSWRPFRGPPSARTSPSRGGRGPVHIGDRFRIGTAELVVTQPRLPCYKLALRFDRDDMLERLLGSGRTGFYFAIARKGRSGRRRHGAHP